MKYDMTICNCGVIHMIDNEKIDKALAEDKNVLLICAHCGKGTLIGADKQPDWDNPEKTAYMMYKSEFAYETSIITTSDFENTEDKKGISEIIYSKGYKVPMMTGFHATNYLGGNFYDNSGPDLYEFNMYSKAEDIQRLVENYKNNRKVVNMKAFINQTPEDILETLSHYYIEGLNFKGTKWEKDWHR